MENMNLSDEEIELMIHKCKFVDKYLFIIFRKKNLFLNIFFFKLIKLDHQR
jgi:hypothetical protein